MFIYDNLVVFGSKIEKSHTYVYCPFIVFSLALDTKIEDDTKFPNQASGLQVCCSFGQGIPEGEIAVQGGGQPSNRH